MSLRLRDVLTAPFVLRSESVERADGSWVRVVSYPELGCSIAGVEDVLRRAGLAGWIARLDEPL